MSDFDPEGAWPPEAYRDRDQGLGFPTPRERYQPDRGGPGWKTWGCLGGCLISTLLWPGVVAGLIIVTLLLFGFAGWHALENGSLLFLLGIIAVVVGGRMFYRYRERKFYERQSSSGYDLPRSGFAGSPLYDRRPRRRRRKRID